MLGSTSVHFKTCMSAIWALVLQDVEVHDQGGSVTFWKTLRKLGGKYKKAQSLNAQKIVLDGRILCRTISNAGDQVTNL